jgi:hypothetical protein
MTFDALAVMRVGKASSLKTLTVASDAVVVGKCVGKKSEMVGRIIETDYEIEVSEVLKGSVYRPGQRLTITVPGGDLTTPPISMAVPAQARMFVGEKVALFLSTKPVAGMAGQTPRPNAHKSKLLTTPRVVGGEEGKFSIYTDAADGAEKVTRINLEDYGYVHNDRVLERMLRAMAVGDLQVTSAPVVDLGGGTYTTPEGQALLDAALSASGDAAPVAGKKSPAKGTGVPPAQDFEAFKTMVKQFSIETPRQ